MTGWTIGSVTLPYGPERIDVVGPPKIEMFDIDGDEPIAEVVAPATKGIVLYGTVSSPTSSKSTVNGSYISGLLTARGTSASVTDPDGIYSGTYLVADVKITDESQGAYVRYRYTVTLQVVTSVNAL